MQACPYTRGQVTRAGEALRADPPDEVAVERAMPVISAWRSAHAYPLNTFQATLRKRLQAIGLTTGEAPVGQRLKRLASIETKLRRFPGMELARMQDIAGLRAVVPGIGKLRLLRALYDESPRFTHELRTQHDYVASPKDDGYRSMHLVYRYQNPRAPDYNGLHVELQLRTQLQHAWATAVETVDTFTGQAIKAGRPTQRWGHFFQLASAAFAHSEKQPPSTLFQRESIQEIRQQLCDVEMELQVVDKMRGFSVAAHNIHRRGKSADYHLVVLDFSTYRLTTRSYSTEELERAVADYAEAEMRTMNGEPIDAVLVAGGGVQQLRRTYPNYFLDASMFVKQIELICRKLRRPSAPSLGRGRPPPPRKRL